ncbi:MAG TPA: hypothetical protein VIL32_17105, partial [Steroidobacteraceae bacterium]
IICQRPFEPDKAPAFYNTDVRAPTKSIIPLDDRQIEQIAGNPAYLTQQAQQFNAGNISVTIPPGELMLPADIFMGYIIVNSLDDRPIHFASTTQAYEELNLTSHILRQGVAYKLINGPIQPDPAKGIVPMPRELELATGPVLDLNRTALLLDSVFVHSSGFPDSFKNWVDGATRQIPMYYGYTHWGLAQAYAQVGDTARAQHHMEAGERFLSLSRR